MIRYYIDNVDIIQSTRHSNLYDICNIEAGNIGFISDINLAKKFAFVQDSYSTNDHMLSARVLYQITQFINMLESAKFLEM